MTVFSVLQSKSSFKDNLAYQFYLQIQTLMTRIYCQFNSIIINICTIKSKIVILKNFHVPIFAPMGNIKTTFYIKKEGANPLYN